MQAEGASTDVVEMGPAESAPDDGDPGSRVVFGAGKRTATLTLEASPQSVPAARAWARDLAAQWDLGDLDWPLLQLVTELVTNCVLHARTRAVLCLAQELETSLVRCEVSDLSPVPLRRRVHSAQATTGRGLQMLERLSS
jgi:hypothetical protein